MSFLLVYATHDGHTRKIMTKIACELRAAGHDCELQELISGREPLDLKQDQKLVLGAAIRYGNIVPTARRWISEHLTQLNASGIAAFTVCLTARKPEKATPETNHYFKKFVARSGLKPRNCAVFAGALRYPEYSWFDRVMIQLIMHLTGGPTDRHASIEYTDWTEVKKFAADLAQSQASISA
ncbi:menaquinone-dependent protoporphyrinogen IX dehydrogenase [Pseudovibrio sp. SPO723]|uniref:menaquinone-dependent protoporphyrinogen IX dehydrogenase n=1 Tax=Nesiotobacter zosterae TaxID=392721 RepID=UPI0029C3EF96|nr:menaquinone-dependent protoporphyrinogen IX dehydrogenase [Pseudovibrio sp. SPO723]MDX5593935.1 menaquinone-dependent protoporphyrinogen IX dehydrogenase [Pseudovibrio sp. SPO723]